MNLSLWKDRPQLDATAGIGAIDERRLRGGGRVRVTIQLARLG